MSLEANKQYRFFLRPNTIIPKEVILPMQNSLVTVSEISTDNFVFLKGYEYAIDGSTQRFHKRHLIDIDEKFAEDVCAELIADAKRETILN